MSNKSNLYQALQSYRSDLNKQLQVVDDYLTNGSATTTVKYFNARKQLIGFKTINSKWTTVRGKQVVEKKHKDYVLFYTYDIPVLAHSVKVESPFFENTTEYVGATSRHYRQVHVAYATI